MPIRDPRDRFFYPTLIFMMDTYIIPHHRGFAKSQNATGPQGHLAWKSTGHPNFQLAWPFFNIKAA